MSRVDFSWHGSRVLDAVTNATPAGLATAGELCVQRLKETVSVMGPPPSSPGEAPHVDKGDFQDSMTYEISQDGKALIVGSSLDYAGYLELGTSRMEPRPWLGPTIDASRAEIAAAMADGMKAGLSGGGSAPMGPGARDSFVTRIVGNVLGAVKQVRETVSVSARAIGNIAGRFWRVRL